MTDFAKLVPQARAFLRALDANNTRDWFQAHKADYETRLKQPAEALLAEIAPRLRDRTTGGVATKLFRIHRDVRFSKDKTPYNTHLHMLWRDAGREDGPAWLLGIGLDYLRAGWGWMGFGKDQMSDWRSAIDGPHGAAIDAAIRAAGMEVSEPQLKRVPAPHDKDHPLAHHLRRKGLVLWSDPPDVRPDTVMAEFDRTEPVRREIGDLL